MCKITRGVSIIQGGGELENKNFPDPGSGMSPHVHAPGN